MSKYETGTVFHIAFGRTCIPLLVINPNLWLQIGSNDRFYPRTPWRPTPGTHLAQDCHE
jgi:hypothetical protein